jgi:hypothetical protein
VATEEDARFWVGHVKPGHAAEHAEFLRWLESPEAHELFRRRRLTEYTLVDEDGRLTVVFKAPRTGDPRILIDFLRYPGLWPEYWEYERGGVWEPHASLPPARVHWRRAGAA